jgi:hypothetical protein
MLRSLRVGVIQSPGSWLDEDPDWSIALMTD